MTDDVMAARIRALAGALAQSGFARLRVRDGETEIEVRRAARSVVPSPAEDSGERTSERRSDIVASDVVGIVRLLRPPVTEGMDLDGDRELAFVETLGIRNPVRSRGTGRVSSVFVTDGQPVEYGQPLFAIER